MAEELKKDSRSMALFQIFEGLTAKDLNNIFSSGIIRTLSEGEVIFSKNETGQEVFLILSGKIDIFDNLGKSIRIVAELGPGEMLGEMALFEVEHRRTVHAIAREQSEILVLGADVFNELLGRDISKKFLVNIIDMLCHRLHAINHRYIRVKYANDLPVETDHEIGKMRE
jgi:CRP-like cAMP-binding protein